MNTTTAIQSQFHQDKVCAPCKGSGKRGRGKCSECGGSGTAHLKHPRVRFNWGFHDATSDNAAGKPRQIVDVGPQNLRQVSMEFDFWYAQGYAEGLSVKGAPPHTSEPAWLAFTGFQPEGY